MATMVPPQKNVEYIFYVGLVSQADTKLLQNNPTLAAGDVLVSTDGGATSNLDTLPAVTPASSDIVKVTVSTTEMNGDNIIIVFSDAAGSEWCDLIVNIQTSAQSLDTMDTNIDDIETDTAVIGALGAGLTAIPWNSNWDAEVQSECADALTAYDPPTKAEMDTGHGLLATEAKQDTIDTVVDGIQTDLSNATDGLGALKALIDALNDISTADVNAQCDTALSDINLDHLCKNATAAADMTTEVADNTILSRVLSNGDTSAFVPSTDGLQLIRDKETDIETDTAEIGAAGAGLSAVPWNSNWDAEVQSECADALTAYDPPTRAELTTDKNSIITEIDANETKIDALNDLSAANVNAEVLDVLNTDTFAESSSVPAATASLVAKIAWLCALARNKMSQTSTTQTLRNDADDGNIGTSTVSDDGTTATRGEWS